MTAADEELGSRVAARAGRAGVPVDAACAARLAAYLVLLQRWNARMNLTALDTADSGLDRLVIEPLAAARHLPRRGALIDIGSGGGSPAIPIKIANPGLAVRMVESKSRKGAFLREAVRCLGLDGTVVEDCRYQALMTRPEVREAHDVLTLRAVRVDAGVLQELQAFVRSGGALALFRGAGPDDGLRDLPAPLVRQAVHRLVDSLGSRLIIVRKPDQPTGTGDTPTECSTWNVWRRPGLERRDPQRVSATGLPRSQVPNLRADSEWAPAGVPRGTRGKTGAAGQRAGSE